MAASCGSRPLCGSRSAADAISDNCSSSLVTRAGVPVSPPSALSLSFTAVEAFVELALLLGDAIDVGIELFELGELRLGSGEAIGYVSRNGALGAI